MKTIAVFAQKGGTGKTTTVANLGVALSRQGKRVLLIDNDPQGDLTVHFGQPAGDTTMSDVYLGSVNAATAVVNVPAGVDLIPADMNLSGTETEMARMDGAHTRLKEALQPLGRKYDYCLIDCPPGLSILSLNALAAANRLLVPMQPEYFALYGAAQLTTLIQTINDGINPKLRLNGIVLTMYDRRRKLSREIEKIVADQYEAALLQTHVRNNVAVIEAQAAGVDIFTYNKRSNGAQDYTALALEIIDKF